MDWLYLSGGVTCHEAQDAASAIFMGDDGNERTSFTREDFSPLPTTEIGEIGYLPTRIPGSWRCRYSTRRSSYGTARTSLDANASVRLVYTTCRRGAHVVTMTTAIDQAANRTDS